MEEFYRVRRLPPYVFEQVNRAKATARNAGADIIDLGMGNPDLPAPAHVIDKLKDTLGKPRTDRYSASKGIAGLRRAQAGYYERRFGVKLNPDTQIVATLGSKEGFANVAQAITAIGFGIEWINARSRAAKNSGLGSHGTERITPPAIRNPKAWIG